MDTFGHGNNTNYHNCNRHRTFTICFPRSIGLGSETYRMHRQFPRRGNNRMYRMLWQVHLGYNSYNRSPCNHSIVNK